MMSTGRKESGDEDENEIAGNEAHQTRKVRNPKKKLISLRTDGPKTMM
jgi:hypothetical protein